MTINLPGYLGDMSSKFAAAESQHADPWRATDGEQPVFYDARGHRGRVVSALGGLTGAASAAGLALIVTGVLGFASVPALDRIAAPAIAPVAHAHHTIRPHLVKSTAHPVADTPDATHAADPPMARVQRSRSRGRANRVT